MKKLVILILAITLCASVLAVCVSARDFSGQQKTAEDLKQLGLFKGVSDTDFDLERAPTRVEAIVMLIRLLGKEQEVLAGTWRHPFTDVPEWANAYVGYAFETGLTKGVSATQFGGGNADSRTFLTFVLRSLGYSDASGDFSWDNPNELAVKAGVLSSSVDTANFLRADAVSVSYNALEATLKGDNKTLAEKLISAGVFTESQYVDVVGKTYSILFIGNSYTYYNDMPTEIFASFAKAAGVSVDVEAITKGSHALEWYADPSDEYGAKVEAALKGRKKYDYVVLQERSLYPATEPEKFYAAVRNLAERIRATGAEPILYCTWGRKTGSEALETNNLTNESMTHLTAAAYEAIGKELDIKVAHVGFAFYDLFTTQKRIELYDSDKTHPSVAGSYLAAATIFAKIFDTNPVGVPYTSVFSSAVADKMCEAARKAVFETPEIKDKF